MLLLILPSRVAESGYFFSENILQFLLATFNLVARMLHADAIQKAMVIGMRSDFELLSHFTDKCRRQYRRPLAVLDRYEKCAGQIMLVQQFRHFDIGWMTIVCRTSKHD